MTRMAKLHRFGFVKRAPWRAIGDRLSKRTACGTWHQVVPDEQFVLMPRELQCLSCFDKPWPRGRRVTTRAERDEFVIAIEAWLIELSRLGDAMRTLGHGRCHHVNIDPHCYRS